ncbi:MAG: nucleotide exchange factor GrpE [Deltaproteobacteria bacterium]|nr:nucleotide exchange factor GrpE [Deltaproteobacteria bacterium]
MAAVNEQKQDGEPTPDSELEPGDERPVPPTTDWDSALSEALAAVEGRRRDNDVVPASDPVQVPALDYTMAEQVQLRAEVEELRAALQRSQQALARSQAETAQQSTQVATLRRILQRTETDLPQQAARRLIEGLLPAMDHLESLTTFLLSGEELSPQSRQAVEMLDSEWRRALTRLQVEPIEAVGLPFDANLHQMIAQQHVEGQPTGVVLRQVHRGYLMQGKLIRSAAVVVQAAKPTAN